MIHGGQVGVLVGAEVDVGLGVLVATVGRGVYVGLGVYVGRGVYVALAVAVDLGVLVGRCV